MLLEAFVAYHGTVHNFEKFTELVPPHASKWLDTRLGIHFAKDPNVANSFTGRRHDVKNRAPHIKRVWIDVDSPYILPQRDYLDYAEHDTDSFKIDALSKVLPKRADLLAYAFIFLSEKYYIPLLSEQGIEDIDVNELMTLCKDVQMGKEVEGLWSKEIQKDIGIADWGWGEEPLYRLLVHNSDKGTDFLNDDNWEIVNEVAKEYRNVLLKEGYKCIQYQNTADSEIEEGDPTCYVVLDLSIIKTSPPQIKEEYYEV